MNASARRAGLHTPGVESLGASPPSTAADRPVSASSSSSSSSSYDSQDEPLMPGQPLPPPGDRPPPPSTNRGGGGSSLRLSDRLQGGSEDSALDSDESGGEMQLSSQPSTPPSPSDFAGSRSLSVGSAGTGSVGSKPPPPPLGSTFGGSETAVRTRTYRSTNAFALRVLQDEKAEQDLPKIARVQACFRGNQCRKKLRIERAIANSYGGLTGDSSEIAPHYLISHMPTEQQVAISRARFATSSVNADIHGKAGKGKHKGSKYLVGPASAKHSQHKKSHHHR